MSLTNQERALSFLRLPLTAQRRRVRPLLALLARLARCGALLAVFGGAAAWSLTSPVFALKGFEVETGERVPQTWVHERLATFTDRNLLRLDLVAVRSQLLDHEWVRAVELKKRLPDHLWVRVVEHRPLAVLRSGEELYYLDAEGGVISGAVIADTEDATGWLVVDAPRAPGAGSADPAVQQRATRSRRRALELAALLEAERPPIATGRLLAVRILGEDDYRLEIEGLPYALLVRPDSARARMELFGRLRDQLVRELDGWGGLEAVDLRFSGRIVLRPTAADEAAGRTSEG